MVLLHAGRVGGEGAESGSGSGGGGGHEMGWERHGRKQRLGKYEVGRTLGEGNFGKVKYARNLESGEPFAIKILEKNRIRDLNITDQIKMEIGTLKLLKHPNVVRLYEKQLQSVEEITAMRQKSNTPILSESARDNLWTIKKEYAKTEDDLKSLQSVGQMIGEVLRPLDNERYIKILLLKMWRISRFIQLVFHQLLLIYNVGVGLLY